MKNFKLLMIALFACGASLSFAQEKEKMEPAQWADKEVEMVSKVVPDLTDDQKAKIKAASLSQFQEMKSLREEKKENREEMKEQMKTLREKKRNSYKEILTQEQYIKYLETKGDNKGRYGKKRGRHDKNFKNKKFKHHKGEKQKDDNK